MTTAEADLLEELRRVVGSAHVIMPEDRPPPGRFDSKEPGQGFATVRPGNTAELSRVVTLIAEAGRAIVTVGGATGLVEGCHTQKGDILIAMERFRDIESVDPVQRTITVGAGVPLQLVQEIAAENQLYFPLDLGARGSATIGGTISTNAGGNRVIRYGMMRDLVLGLEAVLPDGRIVSSMNSLIKNNTGYDLKQLFIGSEGTLGIVTRAVLRLWPAPAERQMALMAFPGVPECGKMLGVIDGDVQGRLTAFEAMWPRFYQLATQGKDGPKAPLPSTHSLYALVEIQGGSDARDILENTLARAIDIGLVEDAVIAQSEGDCDTFWSIRDNVEAITQLGDLLMYDVGLPLSEMDGYVRTLQRELKSTDRVREGVVWGHMGDGNLHIWVACDAIDETVRKQVNHAVYSPLEAIGGSISAEHGIGLEKRDYLHLSRTTEELELMHLIKRAIDPTNSLNPGKVLQLND